MENSVRIERIKKVPSYDAAFDHLTNFYKRRKISHDRTVDTNAVVDLTGDDQSSEEQDQMVDGNDDEGLDDGDMTRQRASDDPCKLMT
jgi:hypothetical protein